MNKPEYLHTTTIGQTRQKYLANRAALDNTLLLVSTGVWGETINLVGESMLNCVLTDILVQQEYIREREKVNYGWRK